MDRALWTEHCGQSAEAQHFCQGIVLVACALGSIISSYITHARRLPLRSVLRTDMRVWARTLDEVTGGQAAMELIPRSSARS